MTRHLDDFSGQTNHNPSQITKVCFFTFNFQDALSHLRMIGPARHLGIEVISGVEDGQVIVDRALLGDVILLQRDFPRAIESYESILTLARQNNIPLILDIDDMLFDLPAHHPDRLKHVFTWTLLPTFRALLEADLVTVTTEPLRDFVFDYNKNVMVLPNFLDDQIWHLKPPAMKAKGEKVVIGYMGGLSHQKDIAFIIPVIHNLIQRFANQLEFHFWGARPDGDLSSYPFVFWHDQMIWNYIDFAVYFQQQSSDILISPLVDNYFNSCKSSIKYLEYSCLGAPGVFSRIEPYSSVITHGKNGLLASTPQEWEDCLVRLVVDPALRFALASNAQADVQSKWALSKNAQLWQTAFQKSNTVEKSMMSEDAPYLELIKNLATQTVMWHRDTDRQIKEQTSRIIELEDLVTRNEATVSGIVNSKTWKLALIFRQIREFLVPPNSRREKVLNFILRTSLSKHNSGKV
jgi:glycosyltransferase involved in cell wall biosynthesis